MIGAELRRMRREAGITQEEMAARLHTTARQIRKIESGRVRYHLALLERAARVLGARFEWRITTEEKRHA